MASPVDVTTLTNISSWKLNKTELKELHNRVAAGEDEKETRREIQTRKAVACEERKRSAETLNKYYMVAFIINLRTHYESVYGRWWQNGPPIN